LGQAKVASPVTALQENDGREIPHGVWAMPLLILTPIKDWKTEQQT
jgi:hypothetical protein